MVFLKTAIGQLLNIIVWVIIIKAALSWFPGAQDSRIYRLLDEFTYPVEYPIRRLLGKYMRGPLDFTPVIAIFLIMLVSGLINRLL